MTTDYYDANSEKFYTATVDVDVADLYVPFTDRLPDGACILDAGCGSGRDALAFLKCGYQVDAFDASAEMARFASDLTGLCVRQLRFDQFDLEDTYDGIWCCASLLHIPFPSLVFQMSLLAGGLKPGGIWFVSFKYGYGEREKDGRLFTDLNEEGLRSVVSQLNSIEIDQVWTSEDVRPGRSEKWLNAILLKAV